MDHLTTSDGRLRVWEVYRNVSPEELFSYWTVPAKLQLWWPAGAGVEAGAEVSVGGHYRFTEEGQTFIGMFSEVIPGNRLAFSWRPPHEPSTAERQVVVDFEGRDRHTLLTLTQGPYGRDDREAQARQAQLGRWERAFSRLRSALTLQRRKG